MTIYVYLNAEFNSAFKLFEFLRVSVEHVYEVKRLDSDFFTEEL